MEKEDGKTGKQTAGRGGEGPPGGSRGDTEEAAEEKVHRVPTFPPHGHCSHPEVGGQRPGRRGSNLHLCWTLVTGTPGPPRPPVIPSPQMAPVRREEFSPTAPEGSGSLAVVTRPQALKKREEESWKERKGQRRRDSPELQGC